MARTLNVYKAYNFKDKDPVIDELRSLAEQVFGSTNSKALKDIHAAGGPSISCMQAWWRGKTRRPQNPSTEAAGRAMGFRRKWVKMNGRDKTR